MPPTDSDLIRTIRQAAQPLVGATSDFDQLVEDIGDARIVLLGEGSHGTHEFYLARAQITQQLVAEKGFTAVIVEADWPDAYRVNRYIRGLGRDVDADSALGGFKRFPQWMWRNRDVLDLVQWMRLHNDALGGTGQTALGFYGMDLYSLYSSMQATLAYLERVDPQGARRARDRYACFEQFGTDPQRYGYAAEFGMSSDCERQVIEQLRDLLEQAAQYAKMDGIVAEDEYFHAEQNARLVRNAEHYYRSMFRSQDNSWNVRDTHMVETIEHLLAHLDRTRGQQTRCVVWAHNSHLGDARATEMGRRGEINVGQLCRERWGDDVFSVGFTTHTGTVTAATDWGDPAELKRVNPSLQGSYERLFHEAGVDAFYLNLRDGDAVKQALKGERLERAIGVIYRPDTERWSHYFHCSLPQQFDAVIHFGLTRAVEPLERAAKWEMQKAETWPSGV
jgi:erythromycin esterase-like protein